MLDLDLRFAARPRLRAPAALTCALLALSLGASGCDDGDGEGAGGDAAARSDAALNLDAGGEVGPGDAGGDRGPGTDLGTDAEPDAELPPPMPFERVLLDRARITSRGDDANFHNVRSPLDFGRGPFAQATLTIDLDTTCFPFEQWRDDPPPAGHNWPPQCDAFDRNFEVAIDDPEVEGDPPGFEVMRAITPFGGPSRHVIDLTDFANARPGLHRVRVHVTTYSDGAGQVSGSDGGWFITATLAVTPGTPPRPVTAVIPLFDGWIGEADRPENLPFTVPPGTTEARVEYRVTGHGGGAPRAGIDNCIGPAEEFCQRQHIVYFDARREPPFIPWRTDCAEGCTRAIAPEFIGGFEYCAENPTGSIRSVEAPRANWCPGALTPPYTFSPAAWLTPGPHSFAFDVLDIHPEGRWRVSALVYLYGE